MSNYEYYRAAFSQVKAPKDAVEKALCRRPVKKRRMSRLVPIAVVLALLTTTAYAELDNGGVSNLLAPLFGSAQTELVDNIGYPVDASVSVNGYTLTADVVIGDRYTTYIVYTLTRDDGKPVPENVNGFAKYGHYIAHSSSGGAGFIGPRQDGDGTLHIIEEWSSSRPLIGRNVTVTFQDLIAVDPETDACTVVAEGTWELRFALRYRDSTVKLPVKDLHFTDNDGRECTIHEMSVSSLSFRLHMDVQKLEEDDWHFQLTAALRLKDGTVEPIASSNGGSSGTTGKASQKAYYTGSFSVPHLVEDIEAIIVCDTEIPVS